jgi:hypothetical protein
LTISIVYFTDEKEWGADVYNQESFESYEAEHESAAIALLSAYVAYLKDSKSNEEK